MKPVKLYWKMINSNAMECYIRRNGSFYGFLRVNKSPPRCQRKGALTQYYIESLIPGPNHIYCDPQAGLKAAKSKARTIVEMMLADLSGITLAE